MMEKKETIGIEDENKVVGIQKKTSSIEQLDIERDAQNIARRSEERYEAF